MTATAAISDTRLDNAVGAVLSRPEVPIPATQVPEVAARITNQIQKSLAEGGSTVVNVKPDWKSKIQVTQVAAFIAILAGLFGVPVDDTTKLQIVGTIGLFGTVTTFVMKRWFTKTVSPSSLG